MKKTSLLIIFLALYNIANSQNWDWAIGNTIPDEPGTISCLAKSINNGGVWIAGNYGQNVNMSPSPATYSSLTLGNITIPAPNAPTSPTQRVYFARINENADVITANYLISNYDQAVSDIKSDEHGNVYICGYIGGPSTFGNISLNAGLGQTGFICKADSNGNFLWAKNISYGGWNKTNAKSIHLNGGKVHLVGEFEYLQVSSEKRLYIHQYDANGTLENNSFINGYTANVLSDAITSDSLNNFYISGHFINNINYQGLDLTGNNSYFDIFLLKMDSNYNLISLKKWGNNNGNESVRGIVSDGRQIYIYGSAEQPFSFGSQQYSTSIASNAFYSALDFNLNEKWIKVFSSNSRSVILQMAYSEIYDKLITAHLNQSQISLCDTSIAAPTVGFDILISDIDSLGNCNFITKTTDNAATWSEGLCINGKYIYNSGSLNTANGNPTKSISFDNIVLNHNSHNSLGFLGKYIVSCTIKSIDAGEYPPVCSNNEEILLTNGLPAGGVYIGQGVSNGYFSPNQVEANQSLIIYSITDKYDCFYSDTTYITVNESPSVNFQLPKNEYCVNQTNVNIQFGTPPGGSYFGPGVSTSIFNPNIAGVGVHTISYSFVDQNGCSATANDTVYVFECLSIGEDVSAPHQVAIYPNPTHDFLNIDLKGSDVARKIKILDINGKALYEDIINIKTMNIDISNYSNGVYFLQIDNLYFMKFIKQ